MTPVEETGLRETVRVLHSMGLSLDEVLAELTEEEQVVARNEYNLIEASE